MFGSTPSWFPLLPTHTVVETKLATTVPCLHKLLPVRKVPSGGSKGTQDSGATLSRHFVLEKKKIIIMIPKVSLN